MKKIGLLLIALICSTNFYAQVWDNSKPDNDITFGIRVGASNSSYNSNNHYYKSLSGWGFLAGLNIDFNIIKSFAIESGVYYISNSAVKQKFNNKEEKLSGCEIPVLASLRFLMGEDCSLQLKSGLSASFMVEEPETLKINKPDIAAIVGVGFSIRKVYMGAQYELGVSEIAEDIRKNYFAILLGYNF